MNKNIETIKIGLATLAFIGSFMLGCMFYAHPTNDYSNLIFAVTTFLLAGYYLWRKI